MSLSPLSGVRDARFLILPRQSEVGRNRQFLDFFFFCWYDKRRFRRRFICENVGCCLHVSADNSHENTLSISPARKLRSLSVSLSLASLGIHARSACETVFLANCPQKHRCFIKNVRKCNNLFRYVRETTNNHYRAYRLFTWIYYCLDDFWQESGCGGAD